MTAAFEKASKLQYAVVYAQCFIAHRARNSINYDYLAELVPSQPKHGFGADIFACCQPVPAAV
jgi:hypothetical protein